MSSFLFCQTLTSVKYQECVVRVVTTPKEALSVHVLKVTSWILMAENAVRKVVVEIFFLTCKATVIILPIFIVTFCSCLDEIQKRFRESPFLCYFITLFIFLASQYDPYLLGNWRSTVPHFLNLLTI